MRPKIVIGLLVSALLAFGVLLLLKQQTRNKPAAPVEVAPATPAAPEAANPPPLPAVPPPVAQAPHVWTDDERQAEIDRLQDWSRNDDPQSLSNILMDLTNSEKEVREAAIEAAKQFGSTNAIPTLKAAAVNSTDTDEQIELLQAANFLALPPLSFSPPTPEQIQAAKEKQSQRAAQRQAQMQQNQGQTQNPPSSPQQGSGQP